MLTVRDLMMPDPLTVATEDTLRSAADLLTSAGISGAPVVAGGEVVGMVSLADVMAFEVDDPGVPVFRPELAEPFEEFVPEEADGLAEPASSWFATLWEDAGGEVGSRIDHSEGPEYDPLDEHTVSEVMSRVLYQVAPLTPVTEAARIMNKERIHRLLVVEGGVPVGILTSWDLVRAVAHGELIPASPGPTLVL